MRTFLRPLALLLVFFTAFSSLDAQCENWVGAENEGEASDAHVSYRNLIKGKLPADLAAMSDENLLAAFTLWGKAYTLAPAADGNRASHYRDGRKLYRAKLGKATDAAEKKALTEKLLALYDLELECYPKGEAYLLGRKGYDMFYLVGYDLKALDVLDKAMDIGGDKTEYIVLAPLGQLLAYFFKTEKIDNVKVRALYEKGAAIADANIEKGGTYEQYYKDAKANLVASIAEYEDQIFDCEYFKEDLMPKFRENMEDMDVLKFVISKLKAQGCPETDEALMEVVKQYDVVYATKKAEYEAKLLADNPALGAQRAYEESNYGEAVRLYQVAIDEIDDNDKKGLYYYQIAQIQNAKLGQSGAARQNANKAASVRKNWGKPYILIGDIYGKMSRNCGDAWDQRLAVLASIDKYQYARSIDSESASTANSRIARLSDSMPIKADAFSRGKKEGDKLKVKCGIGETVRLRF
jgi:hypothetical protein